MYSKCTQRVCVGKDGNKKETINNAEIYIYANEYFIHFTLNSSKKVYFKKNGRT